MELGNKRLSVPAALVSASLALAACGSSTAPEARDGLTEIERFQLDFVGSVQPDVYVTQRCLSGSPYEPTGSRVQEPASFLYDRSTDILTVTPNHGEVLQVKGFDQTETYLSPANHISQAILATYGCEYGPADFE